jgi:hypothetical protein
MKGRGKKRERWCEKGEKEQGLASSGTRFTSVPVACCLPLSFFISFFARRLPVHAQDRFNVQGKVERVEKDHVRQEPLCPTATSPAFLLLWTENGCVHRSTGNMAGQNVFTEAVQRQHYLTATSRTTVADLLHTRRDHCQAMVELGSG